MINSLYYPHHLGGAERSVQQIAEGLVRRGHTVLVITLARKGDEFTSQHNGVRIVRVPLFNLYWAFPSTGHMKLLTALWHAIDTFNLMSFSSVHQILKEFRPDLMQTHNLAGFSTSVWLAGRRLGVPIAHVIHDYYLLCPKSSMFRGSSACNRQCTDCRLLRTPQRAASVVVDAVIGVSRFVVDAHLHAGLFPRATIHKVIHNGHDRDPNRSLAKSEPSPAAPLRVGFLGQIQASKGLEVLFKAFSHLPTDSYVLEIGGTGSEFYIARLTTAHQRDNIKFLGKVNPTEFIQNIDLLVVPSVWNEPFGRIVIEAYAQGVPVVGSRVGGISEIIDDGATGFLVTAGDSEALADAIRKMSGFRLRADMGVRAWAKAGEFSTQSVAQRYDTTHLDLLATAR